MISGYNTAKLSRMKVGGKCANYSEIANIEQLGHRMAEVGNNFTIVGKGSNIVFGDWYGGSVFRLCGEFESVSVVGEDLICGGGVSLAKAGYIASEAGLSGLEQLVHIPATVGGGVACNCGAFGGEMRDVVKLVEVVEGGKRMILLGKDCKFAYRKSGFGGASVVSKVVLSLRRGCKADILQRQREYLCKRWKTQPLDLPSCGSVFKMCEGEPASRLLDQVGLKGFSVGGLQISKKHAGFVVNTGGATPSDFLEICRVAEERVFAEFGKRLEREVRFVGDICKK